MKKMMLFLSLMLVSLHAFAAEITVSAAASLTNAFKDIAAEYEVKYPDAKVNLNFAGSGTLLQQIDKGAPVDVFASADEKTMNMAAEKALIKEDSRQLFAKNALVVIVPQDSALKVSKLDDLLKANVKKVALSNTENVPVGRYSKTILIENNIWEPIQTKLITTQHVRQSLDYVARSEVDAGFVYATDAAIMPEKVKVAYDIPLKQQILYPVAIIKSTKQAAEAQRFIEFIGTPTAQTILQKYGFKQP